MSTLAPDKTFSLAQLLQHRKRSWSTIDEEESTAKKETDLNNKTARQIAEALRIRTG